MRLTIKDLDLECPLSKSVTEAVDDRSKEYKADHVFSWDIPRVLFRNYVMLVLLMERSCRMGM